MGLRVNPFLAFSEWEEEKCVFRAFFCCKFLFTNIAGVGSALVLGNGLLMMVDMTLKWLFILQLLGTVRTLIGNCLRMISLDMVRQEVSLGKQQPTISALEGNIFKQRLIGMHSLKVSPKSMSVGWYVKANKAFFKIFRGFLVILCDMDSSLGYGPK